MVRIATIGTNFVHDMFMDGATQVPACEVACACSRSEENARRVADKWGIPRICLSQDELAADPTIDAVWIATPNKFHLEHAKKFLAAGKHVLLEKPAVTSMADFRELMAARDSSGRVLMEAMRPVHGPYVPLLKELIAGIGPVRRVRFALEAFSSRYQAFREGTIQNAFNPALQNSSMLDMGCYVISMCVALFGAPTSVQAHSVFLHNGFEGEGSLTLGYDGMIANLTYSKVASAFSGSEIVGEDGSIWIDKIDIPHVIRVRHRGSDEVQEIYDPLGQHSMQFEVEDFCRAVAGELDLAPYLQISEDAMAVMDEVIRQVGITFE